MLNHKNSIEKQKKNFHIEFFLFKQREFGNKFLIISEKGVSGTADLLQEPWFMASLGSVLFILLMIFCILFYLRRSNLALRRKTYPPLQIQQMGIPFHPGMQTTTTLLPPDSSAILGRRPVGTYAGGAARSGPWLHTDNQHCEWAGPPGNNGELKENLLSSFDIPLGAYGGQNGDNGASPYATATLAMQKQRHMQQEYNQHGNVNHRNCPQHPPLYNEVLDDMNKKASHYDNGACHPLDTNSSLSSRSHQSHPETVSDKARLWPCFLISKGPVKYVRKISQEIVFQKYWKLKLTKH